MKFIEAGTVSVFMGIIYIFSPPSFWVVASLTHTSHIRERGVCSKTWYLNPTNFIFSNNLLKLTLMLVYGSPILGLEKHRNVQDSFL